MRATLTTLALAALALPTLASNPVKDANTGTVWLTHGMMTYEVFEATVEHADLEFCPPDLDPEAVFCRLTLAADQAHVFVFSHAGEQPLLAIRSYPTAEGLLRL